MKILLFMTAFIISLFLSAIDAGADQTYTVRKGDSLYKIAKKFNVGIEKIKTANNLSSIDLKPGTKLTIPSKNTPAKNIKSDVQTTKASKKNEPKINTAHTETVIAAPRHSHDNRYHTVRKGDTLASISKEYSVPVDELKELNNINNKAKLRIGQQVAIKMTGPKTYTAKKGDNIMRIARKFNIDIEELIEINELDSIDLKAGQKLLVEPWVEEPLVQQNYTAILSESKIVENIKLSSHLPDIDSLSIRDRVTLFAKKMLDIPYKFGGSSFMGIDCSAYVQKVFGLIDVPLPRTAREQFTVGEPVSKDDLSVGDLVFFRTYASFPSHVGIYLGNNLFIHASSKNRRVTIDNFDTPYYVKRFIGAKRFFMDDVMDDKNEKEDKERG